MKTRKALEFCRYDEDTPLGIAFAYGSIGKCKRKLPDGKCDIDKKQCKIFRYNRDFFNNNKPLG